MIRRFLLGVMVAVGVLCAPTASFCGNTETASWASDGADGIWVAVDPFSEKWVLPSLPVMGDQFRVVSAHAYGMTPGSVARLERLGGGIVWEARATSSWLVDENLERTGLLVPRQSADAWQLSYVGNTETTQTGTNLILYVHAKRVSVSPTIAPLSSRDAGWNPMKFVSRPSVPNP